MSSDATVHNIDSVVKYLNTQVFKYYPSIWYLKMVFKYSIKLGI